MSHYGKVKILFVIEYWFSMKASYEAGDVDVKRQVLEIVKRRVVKDYFIIGILEQFEDTLALFEIMLPMFYKGATDAWKSDCKYLITSGHASKLRLSNLTFSSEVDAHIPGLFKIGRS